MALADAESASFSTSMVGFKCAYTWIFTVLQIGTLYSSSRIAPSLTLTPDNDVIIVTMATILFCVPKTPLSICASTTVLIPICWLAASLLLGYFVAILEMCVHRALARARGTLVHLDLQRRLVRRRPVRGKQVHLNSTAPPAQHFRPASVHRPAAPLDLIPLASLGRRGELTYRSEFQLREAAAVGHASTCWILQSHHSDCRCV
ncbi:hypothetical protein BJV78DRAFT_415165 [Lactifluus subvellereus]|nr:hypothetical protein BJV78DRAFT_415165 [Lactifluus subvellereus]